MPKYILGNKPPIPNIDAGSGDWCADPFPSPEAWALKVALETFLPSEGLKIVPSVRYVTRKSLPDAVNHLNHYLGNTGQTLHVDMNDYTARSDRLYTHYRTELNLAKKFAETISPGKFSITSSEALWGKFKKNENRALSLTGESDLHYAVGGYNFWGQADIFIEKITDQKYKCNMIFWFHFYDKYNWDWDPNNPEKQKSAEPFGIRIKDEMLQQLHHHCLAREFDIKGLIESKISWEYAPNSHGRNETPNRTGELKSSNEKEKYEHDPDRA